MITNKDIFIIEDSSADRLRIRHLCEHAGKSFMFAWDGNKKMILPIEEIEDKVRKLAPKLILVDLSWTTDDDKLMDQFKFMTCSAIAETLKESEHNISGFEFLKKIVGDDNISGNQRKLKIRIMTGYIPSMSYGLRQYLIDQFEIDEKWIFHKWRDHHNLEQLITGV